jgi:uncharacterized hydrophobic protein (TIGR00341 family)
MALRLVEVILPKGNEGTVEKLVEDLEIEEIWHIKVSEERTMSRVLISSEESEALMDALDKSFSGTEGFRVIVHSITASLPRKTEEKEDTRKEEDRESEAEARISSRVNREELYVGVSDTARLTRVYLVAVALSVIVASIGLVKDNVAVIIGAMVIAPLLGPNMALSLATTLADARLAKLSAKTLSVGIIFSTAFALALGYALQVDPTTTEIVSRTNVGLGDVALALASGSAGALFLTIGISTALVGVMLAVAILPPLVTFGLLIGSGNFELAIDAILLFATNLICVNLAGVVTFVAQGVRPRSWWEADKAKKLTLSAVAIWCVLLAILIGLIVFWGKGGL